MAEWNISSGGPSLTLEDTGENPAAVSKLQRRSGSKNLNRQTRRIQATTNWRILSFATGRR